MNNIEIKNIKLINLQVSVDNKKIDYDPKKVQAILQVKYVIEKDDKRIKYHIIVGEDRENSLYHVDCEYYFEVNMDDWIEQDIISVAMEIIHPRIEEILALITIEAGYIEFEKH